VLRDEASARRRARSAAASSAGPAPGSATLGRAWLTEADILHHRDVRIDAHQDVCTGGGIEGLENVKRELHLGKITSILLFLFSLLHSGKIWHYFYYTFLLIYGSIKYKILCAYMVYYFFYIEHVWYASSGWAYYLDREDTWHTKR
jgi:hypothetical protein